MQEPREFRIDIGDIELAVLQWSGTGDPILMLHATGFHSRCWSEVVKRLPGQQVYAVDLRFHGGSGTGDQVDWKLMTRDIQILIERLELTHVVGVGHSIGGHLLARVAAALPSHFKQLLLIDPVILAPEQYTAMREIAEKLNAADHPVSRRRNQWQDAREMYLRFQDKAPFDSWDQRVLIDYCDYALKPADENGIRQLLCDPINEAAIYLNQLGNEVVFNELPGIETPTTLLRAPTGDSTAHDFSSSPTWPKLASALPNCRDIYLPQCNHFIPMQDPGLVADYILQAQSGQWR